MTVTGYEDGETQTETGPALLGSTTLTSDNNGALQLSCRIFHRADLGNIQSCNIILKHNLNINLHRKIFLHTTYYERNLLGIRIKSFLSFIDSLFKSRETLINILQQEVDRSEVSGHHLLQLVVQFGLQSLQTIR